MNATLNVRSKAAPDELEVLLDILEDPVAVGIDEASKKVAGAIERCTEAAPPSSPLLMVRAADVLGRMPGIDRAEQRINGMLAVFLYFYNTGAPADIIAITDKAVDLARRSSHPLLRKALTFQGIAEMERGNTPQAIECYAEALDLAKAQGDVDAEASVLNNLSLALAYSAQFRDALAVLERIVYLGTSGASTTFAQTAASNIAYCCLQTGDTERGLRAAERALLGVSEPVTALATVGRVLREQFYARLLLESGEIQSAASHAALSLHYAAKCTSLRATIAATMTQGLCEVYSGRSEAGIEILKRMVEQSRRELPIMLGDLLAIVVKAYEYLEMPREALAHLQELLEWRRRRQHDNALEHLGLQLESLDGTGADSAFASQLRSREARLRGKVAEQEMYRSPIEMLERLAVTAELREDSTGEHCYRLGKLAGLLASEAGSDAATCERIELAARLHDLGKNAIPDTIILKRGKLTEDERQIMRTHTSLGADLIASSQIPQMELAEQIARHHHDWWDGSKGEKNAGEAIPYAARIVAIADVFDALTHDRPHRGAWTSQESLEEIARLSGTQLDPNLARLFTAMILRLRREHRNLDAFLGEAAKSSRFLQARSRIKNALQDAQ